MVLFLLTTAFEKFSQGKLDCTAFTFVVLKTCSSGIDLHCLSTAVNVLMCSHVVLKKNLSLWDWLTVFSWQKAVCGCWCWCCSWWSFTNSSGRGSVFSVEVFLFFLSFLSALCLLMNARPSLLTYRVQYSNDWAISYVECSFSKRKHFSMLTLYHKWDNL